MKGVSRCSIYGLVGVTCAAILFIVNWFDCIHLHKQLVFYLYNWSTSTLIGVYQSKSYHLRRLVQNDSRGHQIHPHNTSYARRVKHRFVGPNMVDGLHNEEVAVLITSTAKDSGVFIRER
jgi:hypothetical protein